MSGDENGFNVRDGVTPRGAAIVPRDESWRNNPQPFHQYLMLQFRKRQGRAVNAASREISDALSPAPLVEGKQGAGDDQMAKTRVRADVPCPNRCVGGSVEIEAWDYPSDLAPGDSDVRVLSACTKCGADEFSESALDDMWWYALRQESTWPQ